MILPIRKNICKSVALQTSRNSVAYCLGGMFGSYSVQSAIYRTIGQLTMVIMITWTDLYREWKLQ